MNPILPTHYIARYAAHTASYSFCRLVRETKTLLVVEMLAKTETGEWTVAPGQPRSFNQRNGEEKGSSYNPARIYSDVDNGLRLQAAKEERTALKKRQHGATAYLSTVIGRHHNGWGEFCGDERWVAMLEELAAKAKALLEVEEAEEKARDARREAEMNIQYPI